MNILHLMDERWDSGLGAYALQIAKLLSDAGEDVVMGVLPGKKPEAAARKMGLSTEPARTVPQLWRLLSSRQWDIVNVHTGRTHTWSVLMRAWGAPSMRAAIFRTRGDARPVSSGALARQLYRWTDGVIASSSHIANQYEEGFRLSDERLRVIYPSIEADAHASAHEPGTVGILGRLDPVKGHSTFLEAAAHILRQRPTIRFLVAGAEAGVSIEILRNQTRSLGIDDKVQFLGFQPDARAFMRRCAVGVIASVGSEEVSRACLEWMSVGRPVVGTLVGCLPELIEPSETGALVPPGNGAALSDALIALLDNAELSHRLGENARHVIARRFSPAAQVKDTLNFYRWALAQRSAAR